MTTMTNNDASLKLTAPFTSDSLEWRVGTTFRNGKGIVFPYITSRAIQERLDEAVGTDNWKVSYKEIDGGFLATLSICVDNHWIDKEDGAGRTDVESVKGGISGAFKRAASVWGIGRYLYRLPKVTVELKDGKYFNGKITLPDWALPEAERTGNDEIKVTYPENFSSPAVEKIPGSGK